MGKTKIELKESITAEDREFDEAIEEVLAASHPAAEMEERHLGISVETGEGFEWMRGEGMVRVTEHTWISDRDGGMDWGDPKDWPLDDMLDDEDDPDLWN